MWFSVIFRYFDFEVNGTTTAEVDYLGKYYWKEIKPSEGCKVAGNLDVDLLYNNQNVPVIVKDMISYEPLSKPDWAIPCSLDSIVDTFVPSVL